MEHGTKISGYILFYWCIDNDWSWRILGDGESRDTVKTVLNLLASMGAWCCNIRPIDEMPMIWWYWNAQLASIANLSRSAQQPT